MVDMFGMINVHLASNLAIGGRIEAYLGPSSRSDNTL